MRGGAGELGDDRLPFLREQLLLGGLEALLHPHLLAEIGEDADAADRRLAFVDERTGEGDRQVLAERVDDLRLQPLDPSAPGTDHPHDLLRGARRVETARVAADDLVRGLAVDALGGAVEEHDATAEVGADDRVDGRVDDALEEVLRLDELGLDLALTGDVAEAAEDGAFLAEDAREVHVHDEPPVVRRLQADVDVLRELPLHEAGAEVVRERDLVAGEDVAEEPAGEIALRVAGDLARLRVREEEAAFGVDHDDAVGGALPEVGVPLERAHPPLRLEPRDGDLLGLIAERLEDARVPERDRHRRRDRLAEADLAAREDAATAGAEEEDAERAPLVEDREDRDRREGRRPLPRRAEQLEERMLRGVLDDERLAAREHLLDLGVLLEVDRQVTELLVVGSGDDVADVLLLADEDDRDTVDLRDLRDPLHDGEEDPAEVEVRRERLRQLEDDLRVLLLARERLHRLAEAELSPHAGDELDGLERLPDEVVRTGLERLRDLVLRVERGEHDDRQVLRLRPRAEDAEHLVAVGLRHHQVEQDDRRAEVLELREGLGAGRHRDVLELGAGQGLAEDMATHHVVVDDQNRPDAHVREHIGRAVEEANGAKKRSSRAENPGFG